MTPQVLIHELRKGAWHFFAYRSPVPTKHQLVNVNFYDDQEVLELTDEHGRKFRVELYKGFKIARGAAESISICVDLETEVAWTTSGDTSTLTKTKSSQLILIFTQAS